MTDTSIVAIISSIVAAIPPTIMAYAALRQSRKNREASKEEARVNDEANEDIKAKVQEVHVLTNGTSTKLQEALAAANEKIASMEKLIGSLIARK